MRWSKAVEISLHVATGGEIRTYDQELHADHAVLVGASFLRLLGWMLVPGILGFQLGKLVHRERSAQVDQEILRIVGEVTGDRGYSPQQEERIKKSALEDAKKLQDSYRSNGGNEH